MPTPRRLRWLFIESPIYYITTCTYNRRRILDRNDVHDAFVQFASSAPEHGAHVGRYVIMPDHVHLFAAFAPESVSVSAWTKSLKNTLSKALRDSGFPSPHWQRGFFDHVIRSEESYEQKWLYVRENPVRAGIVEASDLWPFAGEVSNLLLWK